MRVYVDVYAHMDVYKNILFECVCTGGDRL